jgi:lysozyme
VSALVRGIDVSSWNHPGNRPIDWEKVRAAGITFAMVKATQGVNYVSPWLKEDLDSAALAGLLVGAYHFYEVGPEAVAQAAYFTNALTGHVLELGAWLDWEPPETDAYSAAALVNQFVTHAEEVRNPVGVYCDQSWRAILATGNAKVARWWAAAPGVADPPTNAFIWQTGTEDVEGVSGPVDSDRLLVTRGINFPSSPVAPRPSEAAQKPAEAAKPAEAESERASTPESAPAKSEAAPVA